MGWFRPTLARTAPVRASECWSAAAEDTIYATASPLGAFLRQTYRSLLGHQLHQQTQVPRLSSFDGTPSHYVGNFWCVKTACILFPAPELVLCKVALHRPSSVIEGQLSSPACPRPLSCMGHLLWLTGCHLDVICYAGRDHSSCAVKLPCTLPKIPPLKGLRRSFACWEQTTEAPRLPDMQLARHLFSSDSSLHR